MKKYIYILAALSMVPTFALAQSTLESDVDAELDSMYSSQAQTTAAPAALPVQQVQAAQVAQPALNGSQPIYILNQAPATANAAVSQQQIQKQPTTVIEAAPLAESRAEQIRKARQETEVQTEQKIVEKLEQSRMEDEKRRADALFGDKFNNMNNQQQQVPVQQPVQQVVQPQAVVVPVQEVKEPKENTRDIIREELASVLKKDEVAPVEPVKSKYVAGMLGIGEYPDVNNVKGNYALGFAFGNKVDGFIIEGSFLYSNYEVNPNYNGWNYYNNIDVNQYTGALAAKIQFFDGIVKPVIGGIVAYSYRTYEMKNNGLLMANGNQNATANSHAVDFGALVGADLEFSPKYSIGLDFRYMWNLSNRINYDNTYGTAAQNQWENTNPLEKLQYYVMSVSGRMNF